MIKLNLKVGDTIWIFKRHYSAFNPQSLINDFIEPISHKIETLQFVYDKRKKTYNISTRIKLSYDREGWYCLGGLEDYFLTEEDAKNSIEKIKIKLIKQIKEQQLLYNTVAQEIAENIRLGNLLIANLTK